MEKGEEEGMFFTDKMGQEQKEMPEGEERFPLTTVLGRIRRRRLNLPQLFNLTRNLNLNLN